MKKIYILIFLILIFLEGVLALSSNMKDTYQPKETIIAQLSGEILQDIAPSQIKLKRGNFEVAFEYDIRRINDIYYFWLIAPQTKAEYTLIIEDIVANIGGYPTIIDYKKRFSVSGNTVDYNIKPGLIYTRKDFQIVVHLFDNFPKTIEVSFPSQRQINLRQGINYVDFSLDNFYGTSFLDIKVGKYNVPAYIIGKKNISICGNNIVEYGEDCDGTNLSGKTCSNLGFGGGTLSCYPKNHQNQCRFDFTGCFNFPPQPVCGNNIVEYGEDCDGTNLSGKTCSNLGFGGGTLSCYPKNHQNQCRFDFTGCFNFPPQPVCGNNIVEYGEDCDGTNLSGKTCSNLGFGGGTLSCYPKNHQNQCRFDFTGCFNFPPQPVCGNNIVEYGEDCDGTNLSGKTCSNLNLGEGNLSCYPKEHQNQSFRCRFDTRGCQNGSETPPPPQQTCVEVNGTCKWQCSSNELRTNHTCRFFYICCVPKINETNTETNISKLREINYRVDPEIIKSVVLRSNKTYDYKFKVTNLDNVSIQNLTFSYNKELLSIIPEKVTIPPNSSATLSIIFSGNLTKELREVVTLDVNGEKKYLLLKISFTKNKSQQTTEYLRHTRENRTMYYCSELSGVLCNIGETCDGNIVKSLEREICCIGRCTKTSEEKNYSWIGYLILGILFLFILIVFFKYKKVKPSSKQEILNKSHNKRFP